VIVRSFEVLVIKVKSDIDWDLIGAAYPSNDFLTLVGLTKDFLELLPAALACITGAPFVLYINFKYVV